MLASPVGRADLIGLLAAAAWAEHLPGRLWPLEGALERVAREAPADGQLAEGVGPWRTDANAVHSRFPGLRAVVAELVAAGHLTPTGGRYEVDAQWRTHYWKRIEVLRKEDRAAIRAAGQALVSMATISSKSAATALSSR